MTNKVPLKAMPLKYLIKCLIGKFRKHGNNPCLVWIDHQAFDWFEYANDVFFISPPLLPAYQEALDHCNGKYITWGKNRRDETLKAFLFNSDSDLLAYNLMTSDLV